MVTDSWCVLDKAVSDTEVCHFADSPTVQVDLDGVRDECAKEPDLQALYRPFDCNVSFSGKMVDDMVVNHGIPLEQQGPDRCRLRASLLFSEPPP